MANDFGLDFAGVASIPDVARHDAKPPRIGVWVPSADTDSIGWVRYSLDQRQVPYTYVRDEDIRQGTSATNLMCCFMDMWIWSWPNKLSVCQKGGGQCPTRKRRRLRASALQPNRTTLQEALATKDWPRSKNLWMTAELMVTLGSGSMLALEGGIVRGVRRSSGGVPRSTQGGGSDSAAAAQNAATRTPGAHVRVSFDRPDHPIAYGYPVNTWVFRQNFPLYDTPKKWLRMAYCTTCLDGPEDPSPVVMEWGSKDGSPFVVSGQAWGEQNLIGRPAILDMPEGKGHVVAFNFNPMHRDLNRGDQRLLWNAILNWEAIVNAKQN